MPAAATKLNPDKKVPSSSIKGVSHSPGNRKGSKTPALTFPICSDPVEAGKKKGHDAHIFCDGTLTRILMGLRSMQRLIQGSL